MTQQVQRIHEFPGLGSVVYHVLKQYDCVTRYVTILSNKTFLSRDLPNLNERDMIYEPPVDVSPK